MKTFKFGPHKKVCEDHFEPTCFVENLQAKLLGYESRKRLKADAVPTIFSFAPKETTTGRTYRAEKRQKLINNSNSPCSIVIVFGKQTRFTMALIAKSKVYTVLMASG